MGPSQENESLCINIRPLQIKGGTFIDLKCVNNLCKVREQYMYHRLYIM